MISFKNKTGFVLATLVLIGSIGINNSSFGGPIRRLAKMEMEKKMQKEKLLMYSAAFKNGERVPVQFTADGQNVSPPLSWGNPPSGTKSFALICDDPDAPMGTWVHWLIYDIPADKKGLEQAIPANATLTDGSKQGTNSFNKLGYGGPSPPKGKPHRYFFKLYALNNMSNLPPATSAKQLHAIIQAHTLAESDLMGTYGR